MNSTMPVLVRCSGSEPNPRDMINKDVLAYVHDKLGYHHPQKEILCKEGGLAMAIRDAGIMPICQRSLQTYKRMRIEKFQETQVGERLCIRISCILFAIGIASVMARLSADVAVVRAITQYTGICSAIGIVMCFCVWVIVISPTRKRAEWRQVSLKGYEDSVPNFALATAMEIHQRVSETDFWIDELVVQNVRQDAFLVVSFSTEAYHLEFWDKPGYDQRREI